MWITSAKLYYLHWLRTKNLDIIRDAPVSTFNCIIRVTTRLSPACSIITQDVLLLFQSCGIQPLSVYFEILWTELHDLNITRTIIQLQQRNVFLSVTSWWKKLQREKRIVVIHLDALYVRIWKYTTEHGHRRLACLHYQTVPYFSTKMCYTIRQEVYLPLQEWKVFQNYNRCCNRNQIFVLLLFLSLRKVLKILFCDGNKFAVTCVKTFQ